MKSTSLTLYDFLCYEVIGALMLLTCNINPKTIDMWLYFVLAYIVGLIVAKLNEMAFWNRFIRNHSCFIQEAKNDLKNVQSNSTQNEYYTDYYKVFGSKVNDNIKILEALFAFVWNLIIPTFIFMIMSMCNPERLKIILSSISTSQSTCTCYCCNMVNIESIAICFCPLIFTIIALGFASYVKYIIDCFNKNEVSHYRSLVCGILLIVVLLLCLSYCIYLCCFAKKDGDITMQSIRLLLVLLLVLLPCVAVHIQQKISTLIVEGGYYLR